MPHLKIATEVFDSVNTSGEQVSLDATIKDYLKPGSVIIFHDEMNYGLSKTVKVVNVSNDKDLIVASFTTPH